MKESKRISEMFSDLYEGHPWIDVNITDSLRNISPQEACRNHFGLNSIWQLLVHIVSWRKLNLQRLQGQKLNTPSHNFIYPVHDASEFQWQALLEDLRESQKEWLDYLSCLNDEDLDNINETNGMSYYKQIHGMLQHDAYHLGQVVLLTKLTGLNT